MIVKSHRLFAIITVNNIQKYGIPMPSKLNLSFFLTSSGYWISLFFIPLLILEISQSAFMVSVAYALDIIPYILLTPFAGILGDRYNKKKLILFGEICCFFSALLLFITPHHLDYLNLILFGGFLISSFSAIHHPIFQSILPELYQGDALIKTNADIASINSFTGIIAPALLGISFAFIGGNLILLLIMLCYLGSFGAFYLIEYHHKKPTNATFSLKAEFTESLTFLKQAKELMAFSYLFFFTNFGLRMVFSSLIWIFSIKYSNFPEEIALNFVIIGVMSILGATVAGKYIIGKYHSQAVILSSLAIIALFTLSMNLVNSSLILAILWGIVSFFSMFIVVAYFTFRQKAVPNHLLSRVIALTRLISYLAIPPAVLISGYILDHSQNEKLLYSVAGIVMLLTFVYFHFKMKK